jgi:hypothetical protein
MPTTPFQQQKKMGFVKPISNQTLLKLPKSASYVLDFTGPSPLAQGAMGPCGL